MTPIEPVGRPFQVVMLWGGLRGAVTLALALSLPTSLGYWWTIQSIAFDVVLFTLFIQATSMAPLLRHYGLSNH
jgi:CPA1 family monovalent cation:H+ antiporter